MQHWGEDDYNVGTVQLIAMYNFPNSPGMYIGYNNAITINWDARSSDKYTIPLGLTYGKTMLLGSGNGLDLSIGAYSLVEKPENAYEWQLKLGASYYFN